MPVSLLRTVKPPIARRGMSFGTGDSLRWPTAQLGMKLDYSVDIGAEADADDPITSLSFAIAPSGESELAAASLANVEGNLVTVLLSGGVAGRQYKCQLLATCNSGRVLPYLIGLLINPALATFPLVDAPSADFGTPITWAYVSSMNFSNPANSGLLSLI